MDPILDKLAAAQNRINEAESLYRQKIEDQARKLSALQNEINRLKALQCPTDQT